LRLLMSERTSDSCARHMSCSAMPAPVLRASTESMRVLSPPTAVCTVPQGLTLLLMSM
jgi:hypothetical protein